MYTWTWRILPGEGCQGLIFFQWEGQKSLWLKKWLSKLYLSYTVVPISSAWNMLKLNISFRFVVEMYNTKSNIYLQLVIYHLSWHSLILTFACPDIRLFINNKYAIYIDSIHDWLYTSVLYTFSTCWDRLQLLH